MKRMFISTALCACLLCSSAALAKVPMYGLYAVTEVHPEGNNDGDKNLRLAIAVTEKLGQDEPLSFTSWYHFSQDAKKGKVIHKFSIYRGATLLWQKKRAAKVEEWDFTSDTWVGLCDAYKKGLQPGDLVVFDFELKGLTLKKTHGGALFVAVGPNEMWSVGEYYWQPWDSPCQ